MMFCPDDDTDLGGFMQQKNNDTFANENSMLVIEEAPHVKATAKDAGLNLMLEDL